MEFRINNFVKNFCNENQCSVDYISERQKLMEKISNSDEFKTELARHSALSNKNRFIIYSLIQKGVTCNCVLAETIGITEGSITHHIKKLEEAGLIIGRNSGHFTIYYTAEQLKEEL